MEDSFMSKQNLSETKKIGFIEKAKEHKNKIGVAIVISVVAVLVVKNKTSFKNSSGVEKILTNSVATRNNAVPLITEPIEKSVTSSLPNSSMINVREHVRNLPKGWHPSTSKIELAAKYGYPLEEHQTLVNAYTKAA